MEKIINNQHYQKEVKRKKKKEKERQREREKRGRRKAKQLNNEIYNKIFVNCVFCNIDK